MSAVIICPNPECKADNPANAKFCRMCKHPLSTSKDEYTPALFPDIALRPVAVQPVRFVSVLEKISFYALPILLLFLALSWRVPELGLILVSCVVLAFVFCIKGIKHYSRRSPYLNNTDYIEEGYFVQKTRRIAKNKKLGLFDNKSRCVLLTPEYDSILQFDETHIQLSIDNKIGLYSIPLKKIIVPIEFDGIAPVKNGVIEVVKDSHMSHYDTHGNVLK